MKGKKLWTILTILEILAALLPVVVLGFFAWVATAESIDSISMGRKIYFDSILITFITVTWPTLLIGLPLLGRKLITSKKRLSITLFILQIILTTLAYLAIPTFLFAMSGV